MSRVHGRVHRGSTKSDIAPLLIPCRSKCSFTSPPLSTLRGPLVDRVVDPIKYRGTRLWTLWTLYSHTRTFARGGVAGVPAVGRCFSGEGPQRRRPGGVGTRYLLKWNAPLTARSDKEEPC